MCPSCVPTTAISALFSSQIGARAAIGAKPCGNDTLVTILIPLLISSVVERATNGGVAGLADGSALEHDSTLTTMSAASSMTKDLNMQKR